MRIWRTAPHFITTLLLLFSFVGSICGLVLDSMYMARKSLLPVARTASTLSATALASTVPPEIVSPDSAAPNVAAVQGAAKAAARAKRKKLLGFAKAVDRGHPNVVTYTPATKTVPADGGSGGGVDRSCTTTTFRAESGLPDRTRRFTVLGIESSCDDTGAAVVRSDGVILGEALAKQDEIHERWGGVVPGLARDAHVAAMDRVIDQALTRAGLSSVAQVDAIAVTVGPGLEICLRVGCETAVQLARQHGKPFVGVHHLEAHILMARLPYDNNNNNTNNHVHDTIKLPATPDGHELVRTVDFPFLALLVSGGHCQLLQCYGIGQYQILGGTLDDSLGEAFDKTARLLGLPVGGGGGPALERLAAQGNRRAIALTVPMQSRKDCDFSYAGLKTNVRRAGEKLVRERNLERLADNANATTTTAVMESVADLPEADKADLAASFQYVAIQHVEQRLQRVMTMLEESSDIRTLAVVGGVAANQELRSRLELVCANRRPQPWQMLVPPPRLCTDQGA